MIPSYLAFVGFLLIGPQLFSQTAPNAQYATFSPGVLDPAVTMLTGTGSFNCPGAPNFEYSVTGDADFTSGDTNVPSTGQVVDNNPGIEVVYGQADPQQNIEVEVAGFFGAAGSPISMTVFTTIDFASPTTPNEIAFLIADVEQDLSLIHISEPTRQAEISYAVFCLKKKK